MYISYNNIFYGKKLIPILLLEIEKHYPNLKYEVIIINDPNGKEYYRY
jgi:hypothetical protein